MKSWIELMKKDPALGIRYTPLPVWIFLLVFGLVVSLLSGSGDEKSSALVPASLKGIDTLIPKNFSLIPLYDLENQESLDSLLGAYGLVNLYSRVSGKNSEKTLLVTGVKILRAPKNPAQLAVLVPTEKAPLILNAQGPLTALVVHPDQVGMKFESSPSTKALSKAVVSQKRKRPPTRPVLNFSLGTEE